MGLHAVFVVQCSLEFLHFFSRRTAVEYIVPICRTLICMPRSFPDCIDVDIGIHQSGDVSLSSTVCGFVRGTDLRAVLHKVLFNDPARKRPVILRENEAIPGNSILLLVLVNQRKNFPSLRCQRDRADSAFCLCPLDHLMILPSDICQ